MKIIAYTKQTSDSGISRKFAMFFILTLLLVSCTASKTAPVLTPTATTPVPSLTETPTLQPTNTPPPPTATLEPSSFKFDIAPNAPAEDVAEIKLGIDLARAYLRDNAGGDITPDKRNFTIIIAMNGTGCCTALDEFGPRPYFDITDPSWTIATTDYWDDVDHHLNAGAHEYTHDWQSTLGCLKMHYSPLPDWLDEGIAQYVSINSLKSAGYVTKDDITKISYDFSGRIKVRTLATYEINPPVWPGEIGFLAVKRLVEIAPKGPLSLRIVCEEVAAGSSFEQAFEEAFGISKEEFYKTFH